MISLHILLPDVDHDDLLIAKVVRGGTLPVGEYAFVEYHCIEKDCDCRRVIVQVLFEKSQKALAHISYGLDDGALGVDHDGRVYIDPLGPKSQHADSLMQLFLDAVRDQGHDVRIKEHYRLVRKAMADPTHPVHQRLARAGVGGAASGKATAAKPKETVPASPSGAARNDPCPCGSGKKLKKCCLGKPLLRVVETMSTDANVRPAPGAGGGPAAPDAEPSQPVTVGPIARKAQEALRAVKGQKVVNLASVRRAREHAAEQQKSVATTQELKALDPAFAYYAHAQNVLSVISENLTQLHELDPLVRLIGPAEDQYMPGGPPMSPLTTSYFASWAFFDACVGKKRETIGSIVLALAKDLEMAAPLVGAITKMQASRMGLYVHEGFRDRFVLLKELVTDTVIEVVVQAGYHGKPGELWFVRALPPPVAPAGYWVVFTTPYVLVEPGVNEWQAYLERTLPTIKSKDAVAAYKELMKFGLTRKYWNEFIFEAYFNHRTEVIFLKGLPDIEGSRPHGR